MTPEIIFIALLLIVGLVASRVLKSRRATVIQQQQQQASQAEDTEQVLSAALAADNMNYDAGAVPLNLMAGERPLVILPLTHLLEIVTSSRRRGSWGGPSLRVTKGVWYRFGSSQSVTERSDDVRIVDQGTLVVTNDRLAFIGLVRTISAQWSKIVGVNAFSDAVGVHFDRGNKPVYFQPSNTVTLTFTVGDKVHQLLGDAHVLKAAIDVARKGSAPRLEQPQDNRPTASPRSSRRSSRSAKGQV